MATKTRILLSDVTLHVVDPQRSVPAEFDATGAILRGAPAARALPPLTIVALDGGEAETILRRHAGLRIPDDVVDAVAWAKTKAAELGLSLSQIAAIHLA